MKLGLQFGYWTAQPRPARELVDAATFAESLGFDSIWTGESWSSDAFSPLAAVAAATTRVRLCTGIAQISARTPTAMAMHAMTLDGLSEGRACLGIGVSGPQVVEGWYGRPFAKPLARTREYIQVVRDAIARAEPVTNDGEHYPLPYHGEGASGFGKPLKMITHPLRTEIPIYLGAEGPKNVALALEVADGWVPLYYSPHRTDAYDFDARALKPGFEIAVNVTVNVDDDVSEALWPVKATLGFYIGGMGAKTKNFHTELMARMGFEEEAHRIQDLFFEGKRDEAILAVPDAFADEISLVGPKERIAERFEAWRATPVTTMLLGGADPDTMRFMADLTR
ncbi:MAG TPA: LLM class F420-dependent oxidoreductase [Acidimicrobiia bacterium]|nr:LLM class F420-dependent oxidoreductase [Acidimicrobiia bacterium]